MNALEIAAIIAEVIAKLAAAAPTVEAGVENAKPYVLMLYNVVILGQDVTSDQIADLVAKRKALSAQLQQPLSPE